VATTKHVLYTLDPCVAHTAHERKHIRALALIRRLLAVSKQVPVEHPLHGKYLALPAKSLITYNCLYTLDHLLANA